ncbi:MAG: hypothetical protein OXU75_09235 [Deltaproteobacteria bacterium]|nr:hypothetical protein [Deltaproteobacteria bacterium]
MDEAKFKRLVDLLKNPLDHASKCPLPRRNVQLFMALDAGEKAGYRSTPTTEELLDRWIAESVADKNAWDTLDLLSRLEIPLPADLVAWMGAARPHRPRAGEQKANRNRAIRACIEILVWRYDGQDERDELKAQKNDAVVVSCSACDIVAEAISKTYKNIEGVWNKRPR